MKQEIIDAARRLLSYDPETGELRWKESPNRRIKVGSVAGWDHPFGYRQVTVLGHKVYVHRLAWALVHGSVGEYIDHINGNPSDNRIANLRQCTQSQNLMNAKTSKKNTSGVRGVAFDRSINKWTASAKAGDVVKTKRFEKFDDAVAYRAKLESAMFGEYAYRRGAQ
jgi:hypothetical protein